MAATSKAEYLKKYLSENAEEKKKKKKRKVPTGSLKVTKSRIVDDDIDLKQLLPENLSNTLEEDVGDNEPTIAEFVDERPEHVKLMEKYRSSGAWKLMGESENSTPDRQDAQQGRYDSDSEQSLPGRRRHDSDSDQSPTRRKRHDSDSDESPPRKKSDKKFEYLKRVEKKTSPVSNLNTRRKKSRFSDIEPSDKISARQFSDNSRKRHNSDSDQSPPRKNRFNSRSDQSPPRRNRRHDSDSDQSPPRKNRYNSRTDQSPPRKRHHDSDSDQSPPRRGRGGADSDQSPHRRKRHNSDSDQSPPRRKRHHSDSDQSPPRRKRHNSDSDQSPPRRKKSKLGRSRSPVGRKQHDSDSDMSPPRRSHVKGASRDKEQKTLAGKKAGLSSATDMRREAQELRRKEEKKFNEISDEKLGKGAATVFRDRKSGRRRDLEEENRQAEEESRRKAKEDEKYQKWGKGLKQVQQQNVMTEEALHEASKPLARYKDDEDLDKMLREMDRAEDPMLAFIKKKKKTNEAPKKEKPRYKGPAPPPNRFGILPGYRWDGVDRSNGFEKQIFMKTANDKARASQAYKWSVEDM